MNPPSRSILLALVALPLASCASVPAPATRAPDNPASAMAAEGRFEKLELFVPAETPPTAPAAAPSGAAMPAMDPSKMDHSAPSEANPLTSDPASETYTCVMHPQIAEPKPGKCPICGMALEKKLLDKKPKAKK